MNRASRESGSTLEFGLAESSKLTSRPQCQIVHERDSRILPIICQSVSSDFIGFAVTAKDSSSYGLERALTECQDCRGMSQGSEIRRRRKALRLTQRSLAQKADVNTETVHRLEADGDIRVGTLNRVLRALEIAEGDLPGHRGTGEPVDEVEVTDEDVEAGYQPDAIPVIAEGEATPQGLAWSTDIMHDVAIEYISRPRELKDPEAYGLIITGDSMKPYYRRGHRLIASPRAPVHSGTEVYVQLTDGRRMLKLAERIDGGWRLESYNTAYAPIEVKDDDVIAIHAIAWAKRVVPGFRVIDDATGRRRR